MKSIILLCLTLMMFYFVLPATAEQASPRDALGKFKSSLDNCHISNLSRRAQCQKGTVIFAGDILEVSQKPDTTAFIWNDPTRVELVKLASDRSMYRVRYNAPQKFTAAIIDAFQDFYRPLLGGVPILLT